MHSKMLPSLITYILYIFHNGKNMDFFHQKSRLTVGFPW